jgi:hypothetical protein
MRREKSFQFKINLFSREIDDQQHLNPKKMRFRQNKTTSSWRTLNLCTKGVWSRIGCLVILFNYKDIINDCPIAVGVENPHKFWTCRQPRNVRQTSRPISTTKLGRTD